MNDRRSSIFGKFLWTAITYGASLGIRFSTNVVLSRLLGPKILGVMVLAQAFRVGTELLTDVGLEQNVVSSPNGNDQTFLNTAWSVQILRGLGISILSFCLAPFLARFYGLPVEIFLAVSLAPLINSLASTSIFSLSKNLNVKTRSLFELSSELIALAVNVTLAMLMPTVWAPILGVLLGLAARSSLSYFLPHPAHRLVIDRKHFRAIIEFGKWIMLTSFTFFAAMYIDRLFLGRVVSIAVLGVYGLARTISDLPLVLAGRLGFQIVFPVMAGDQEGLDSTSHSDLAPTRLRFLLLVAAGIATVMAWSDKAISILYDRRYHEAGWMLFLLLVGSWAGVLSALNEAAVLGRARPQVVSLANIARILILAAALPIGFAVWGLPGAILALPAGELIRYSILFVAQRRLRIGFIKQDVVVSMSLFAILAAWLVARLTLGLGVPWTDLIHSRP